MSKTYLLLGSNMGDSKSKLAEAIVQIGKKIGPVLRRSGRYVTAAWGDVKQADFLNQVVVVETRLSAGETMDAILQIEKDMGRVRTTKNAPRIIDIDILFFNKQVLHLPHLKVPHPQIQNRRFVLVPLNELSPNLKHPLLDKTVHQLLINCPDKLNVKKF